jgi:RNA polymerase sigma-70 factor (ECF subfamily)
LQSLVAAAKVGDAQALETLLVSVERPLYQFLLRLLGDAAAAEDATQESLLKVCRSLGRYDERGQFLSWVYRIALNQVRDWKRRRRETSEPSPDVSVPGSDPERSQRLERVMEAMQVLTEKERAALVLIDIEGYSSAEAAGILGCLAITARTRAAQARKKVRRALTRYYPELEQEC